MENTITFRRVIIVSNSEDHIKKDKFSLNKFRPETIMTFSTGAEALRALSKGGADIVVCDSTLEDMTGCTFIRILKQKTEYRNTPVIMISVENDRNSVMDAIVAGCTAYILRPYSPETFHRHMLMSRQLERFSEIEEEQLRDANEMVGQGNLDEAIEEFEEILTLQDEAQKYYDMGCDYLLKQKYGKAIIAFNKAVKINHLFAEAYQGLAEAYKGKRDAEMAGHYLQKAAEVHAQFDRLEEAKSLFVEILKYDTHAPNPYNSLGVKLRRNGDYPGAVHAYKRAIELSPEDENIYFNLAKAYFFMDEEEKAKKELTSSLEINGDFAEALKFYRELFGREWPKDKTKPKAASKPRLSVKDV